MAKQIIKKKWYKIIAPAPFEGAEVAEIPTIDSASLKNRICSVNLGALANEMRKQNYELSLVIDKVEGEKAQTSIVGYKVLPTSIKRLVRKNKSRVDQVIRCLTKDNKIATVKLLYITINRVKGSVHNSLLDAAKYFVIEKASSMDFQAFAREIISDSLQKELKKKLAKIYPLKICDIRSLKEERHLKAVEDRRIRAGLAKSIKKSSQKKNSQKENDKQQAPEENKKELEQTADAVKEAKEESVVEETPKEEKIATSE